MSGGARKKELGLRRKGKGSGPREEGERSRPRGREGRTGPTGQKGKRECFLLFFQNYFKTFEFNFEFLVKTTHLNKSNAPTCMHNNVATPYNEFELQQSFYFSMFKCSQTHK